MNNANLAPYSFQKVLDYFEEDHLLEKAVQEIIQRERAKQPNNQQNPFTNLDGCSPEEHAIISEFLEMRRQEAVSQSLQLNDEPQPEVTANSSVYPDPSLFIVANKISAANALGRLLREGKGKEPEAHAYELMHAILQQIYLVNYAGNFYYREGCIFRQLSDQDLRSVIFQIIEPVLATGKNPRIISNVLDLLKDYPAIKVNKMSEPSDRVFFLNGTYNFIHHELVQPLPSDFITSYIPVQYSSDCLACPVFDQFLLSISGGDPAIVSLIWEIIGYLLSYDMAAKSFFLLQGVGDSGKSVLGNLISSMFNTEAVSNLDIYRFKGQFATSALKGKRLNICMDLPRAQISRESIGVLKMLTGDDTITIEQKFRSSESYKPDCKLLFGSNFPLMPADNDPAFRARLVTVPFMHPIPKEQQDKHLLEKLQAERSAIAVKALDAYLNLKSRNYQFTQVKSTMAVTVGYIPDNEMMQSFLSHCCIFSPEAYAYTADLRDAYNQFRVAHNAPPIMDIAIFSRYLNQFCSGRISSKRRRINGQNLNGYSGIGLRQNQKED